MTSARIARELKTLHRRILANKFAEVVMESEVYALVQAYERLEKLDDIKDKKKRKYFRKCGICGERHEQSEMIRTDESPNGWMCLDCKMEFTEYDTDEF